jgi:hypothetical protein
VKRLPVAFLLLAITVGLCVGPLLFLENTTARMTAQLDRAVTALEENNPATLRAAIDDFCRTFHNANRVLPLFFPHEKMDAIEESAALLPLLIEKNAAHLSEELARCQYHVEHLRESERLSFCNVF